MYISRAGRNAGKDGVNKMFRCRRPFVREMELCREIFTGVLPGHSSVARWINTFPFGSLCYCIATPFLNIPCCHYGKLKNAG